MFAFDGLIILKVLIDVNTADIKIGTDSIISLISQVIYLQKIVTIGRRSHRWANCRHKKALAGRAGGGTF